MKKLLFFFVLAVAAGTTTAQTLADAGEKEAKTTAKVLAWESQDYDFGVMEQSKPQTAVFKFQNKTDKAVVISQVKPACGCTVADYSRSPILPGEWGEVKANYNAAAMGQFRKTIQVVTSASETPVSLTITGEVK